MRLGKAWQGLGLVVLGCLAAGSMLVLWNPERRVLDSISVPVKDAEDSVLEAAGGLSWEQAELADPDGELSASADGAVQRAAIENTPFGLTLRVQALWNPGLPMASHEFRVSLLDGSSAVADGLSTASGPITGIVLDRGGSLISQGPPKLRLPEVRDYRTGTTDSDGWVVFEGLPKGPLWIRPVWSRFDASGDERQISMEEDTSYEYLVANGLLFGGRLSGQLGQHVELELRDISNGRLGPKAQRLVHKDDGSFLFRVTRPGHYFAYLFDTSRWQVIQRYPSILIEEDLLGVNYEVPALGSVRLVASGLPAGMALIGSYVRRLEEPDELQRTELWLKSSSSANATEFKDLPYGDYQLFVRGVLDWNDPAGGGGTILECLDLVIDRPEQTIQWSYSPLPTVWLDLTAEELDLPELPTEYLSAGQVSFSTTGDIEISSTGGIKVTLPAGALYPSNEEKELRKKLLVFQAALIKTSIVSGTISVASSDGLLVQRQRFSMKMGAQHGFERGSSLLGNQPIAVQAPRIRDGLIELVIPKVSGYVELRVEAPGFHPQTLEIALVDRSTVKVHLLLIEKSPVPEIVESTER